MVKFFKYAQSSGFSCVVVSLVDFVIDRQRKNILEN